ncbi:MAG: hypothetical protein HON18_11010 [Rhodospirillaceae bacterium]|jgi:hypothetical protein|nr:hypothetical protein [Rhodospirillaceae bacterium]MBT6240429.1 hypothetical protein [Rhodospirillaceae bacterium]
MPGGKHQQIKMTTQGSTALRDLAQLLARHAAAEAMLATKYAGPASAQLPYEEITDGPTDN